jgi:hypothetical protein
MTEKRMREWLIFKVFVPFVFLIIIWPITLLKSVSVAEAFHEAFAHCELLVFSALVFIEIGIEINYLNSRVRDGFNWWPDVARGMSLITIVLYGVLVTLVIGFSHEDTTSAALTVHGLPNDPYAHPHHNQLIWVSVFAFSMAIISVAMSVYAFCKVKHLEVERRVRQAKR